MNSRTSDGFTLIELIIVIAILSIISVMSLPLLQAGFTAYKTQSNLSDANWQGRLALDRFTRDIRSLPAALNISTATATQLIFTDDTNTAVTYSLSGTSLLRNGFTLADGISTLTLGYYTNAGATTATIASIAYISMTLNITQNGVNTTLQTVVDARNVV